MASQRHLVGGDPQAPKKGGESHLKRTRSHQVSCRLSDKEYALLQKKLTASGLSLTEFFIKLIREKKINIINQRFSPSAGRIETTGCESQSACSESESVFACVRERDSDNAARVSDYIQEAY